jgi:hypothetical protein
MALAQIGRQRPRCLAENREVVGDGLLGAAIGLERLSAGRRQFSDVGEPSAHVREPAIVAAETQNSSASRSIRSTPLTHAV